jgi:alpha-galactosidase
LSEGKENHWKEWIALYNQKLLSKGNFLNLYVYGFDTPEGYAIEKDGHYYYAFYAPEPPKEGKNSNAAKKGNSPPQNWHGEVELRGLPAKSFRVSDYVRHKDFGMVTGPTAKLSVDFTGSLLLEATPNP